MSAKTIALSSSGSLLAAAKRLFWKHGIKRVSVEDISSEAGLSKMTFYRNFANKEAIAYELLRSLTEAGHAQFVKIMKQPEPLPDRLRNVIRMKLAYSRGISEEFLHDLLYGNERTRGFDAVGTNGRLPEFGGRLQLPTKKGEIALSFHQRTATTSYPLTTRFPNSGWAWTGSGT
jgi:AcrR family transcriptional regulator